MQIEELLAQLAIAVIAAKLSNTLSNCGIPQSASDFLKLSVKLRLNIKLPPVKIVLWIITLLCAILGLFYEFH